MKNYLKNMKKAWILLNSNDEFEREKGDILWDICVNKYSKYHKKIKGEFPDYFINLLKNSGDFHDFTIQDVVFRPTENNVGKVMITLTKNSFVYKLTFENVKAFKMKISKNHSWIAGKISIGYIMLSKKKKYLKISILCDFDSEIIILFKSVHCVSINDRIEEV